MYGYFWKKNKNKNKITYLLLMHIPPSHISIVVNEKIICMNFTAIYDQEGWLFMVFDQEMLQMK